MARFLRSSRILPEWTKPAAIWSASLLAGLASFAGPPDTLPITNGVSVVNKAEADQRRAALADLGVLRYHQADVRGKGVKIAVLDSGFRGYRNNLGKSLPQQVTTRSFREDGDLEARDSQHGILCAEVLHTIAPEAELLFANWEPDSPESFLRAARWARNSGAKILTCSVIMPSWSDGEGGGDHHVALREILGDGNQPGDPLFFASAGNLAERHWTGSLRPDARQYHQWSFGKHLNRIRPWGTERVAVELYGPMTGTCQLEVFDASTGRLVEQTTLVAAKGRWGIAALRFEPELRRDYFVAIRCPETPPETPFHLVVLGGFLEQGTQRGSIPFPGDGQRVVTLGAVDADLKRLGYSSCGPNSPRPKPDFVAKVPFPIVSRAQPFSGTSAAAPQAAGLAALLLSRSPDQSPDQIHAILRGAALDLLDPGHDCETGYGLLRLP